MPETVPRPGLDPMASRCTACLAPPGDPCLGTTSDLPRERPHRLRPLAAAPILVRCTDCEGSGWRDAGFLAPVRPVACPVCGAAPLSPCTEGGREREALHVVWLRAARLGVEPCPSCDAVGWVPVLRDEHGLISIDNGQPIEFAPPAASAPRPDVPDDLHKLAVAAMNANNELPEDERDMTPHHILAAVLPRARAQVLAELFGTPEPSAESGLPVDAVRLCSTARPGEHEREVRERVAAEQRAAAQAIEDTRGENSDPLAEEIWQTCERDPVAPAVRDDPRTIASVAYLHIAHRIARGES